MKTMWRRLVLGFVVALVVGVTYWKTRSGEAQAKASVGPTERRLGSERQDKGPASQNVSSERQFQKELPREAEVAPDVVFDALTDQWIRPRNAIKQDEIDTYVESFKVLSHAEKLVCIRRAINLIPDENVMLLIAILLDKTTDTSMMRLIYDDILKRSDDIKKKVLDEIHKDKAHPCWRDTHWILSATGELEEEK